MCSSILSQQVSSRFVIWDQLRSKINLSPTIANQPGIAAVPAPQEILLCLPHTWLSPIRMGNEWIVTDSWLWIVPAKHGEWTRRLWLENLKTTFTVKLQLHYFNKKKKGEKKKNLFFITLDTFKVWQHNTPGSQLLFTEYSYQHNSCDPGITVGIKHTAIFCTGCSQHKIRKCSFK